ncbi:MAG: hypothetical protein JJU10_11275 [Idiomarina sp.]|nr:hypothetical protein [Idiomarina sp.]
MFRRIFGRRNPLRGHGLCAIALVGLMTLPVQADSGYRWFEVEVLVFRHSQTDRIDPEQFPLNITPIPIQNSRDLLSINLNNYVDGLLSALPRCSWMRDLPAGIGELSWPLKRKFTPLPDLRTDIFCREHTERLVMDRLYPPTLPKPGIDIWNPAPVIHAGAGADIRTVTTPFLLPRESLTMTQARQQMERRGLGEPLLHTAWRQPVFTRNQTRRHRLFGGRNYTREFDYFGFPRQQEELYSPLQHEERVDTSGLNAVNTLLNAINDGQFRFVRPDQSEQLIPSPPTQIPRGIPEQVWEFDGLMQIYLVGNFLHIDGEFNLREPVSFSQQLTSAEEQANAWLQGGVDEVRYLRAYHFKQLRRVISHEVHYFDHPKFGVLVEIRRTSLSQRR